MLAPQQRKEWVWRRYAMFCFRLRTWLKQPETPSTQQKPFGITTKRFCFQAASSHPRQHRCHNLIFIIQQRQQIQIFRAD